MDSPTGEGVHPAAVDANGRPAAPSVVLVGTSFRTAEIGTRERIARRLSEVPEPGLQVGRGKIFECSILETCNRLEVYLACSSPNEVAKSVMTRLDGDGTSSESFYVKTGADAIRHIFRVASGLDSPVLGEEQILQQVREAGKTARTSGQAKSILSSLFDAAYSSGKRIRESYKVSPANRSVSAFALRRALKELGRRPAKVLLIGSGETAKLAALRLKGSAVYLLSGRRDVEARFPNAERISRRRLREVSEKCDLIIAATRHHGYVLTKRDLPEKRRMVVLDLGFPRNVDPSLRDSKFIRLYDLDAVAAWALSLGRRENASAERLVEEETRRFDVWLTASRLTPTLGNIYKWAERIREEETLAALRRLPGLSSHDKTIIEAMSKRLTGKLLSPHATFVKEVGNGEDQSERLLLLESIFRDGGK
ncbi:MAG: glutamyl-tRNA reductase [Nitrososphaerales archaeon]|nr:glutamyl-tRNA reductase [Nitrososphaerales archaeon]